MFSGVIPILPSPFNRDGRLHEPDYQRLLDYCHLAGVSAVGLPAYGSEFYKLTPSERVSALSAAIAASRQRVPIIAQCNHGGAAAAANLAREAEQLGAAAIAFELPRRFPYAEPELVAFSRTVARAVAVPVLVQDWNPGGATIGADFARALRTDCPNFQALKLEEPNLGEKVLAIREATADDVKVIEGWGGLYLLELLPAGISGIMPGTALADVFVQIFQRARNDLPGAFDDFAPFVPYLTFCLQNMEHFHHVEKALLARRGILTQPHIRELTVRLDATARAYLDLLLDRTCRQIERLGLPVKPLDPAP
jgi:4-hydroxy-tetrahydrodipicolinate synthase